MDALPALPLDVKNRQDNSVAAMYPATGTENATAENIDARTLRPNLTPIVSTKLPTSQLVPNLVPTTGKTSILGAILDNLTAKTVEKQTVDDVAVSAYTVKEKDPLTTGVNGSYQVEPTGIESLTT
jgi:hypothetical protein